MPTVPRSYRCPRCWRRIYDEDPWKHAWECAGLGSGPKSWRESLSLSAKNEHARQTDHYLQVNQEKAARGRRKVMENRKREKEMTAPTMLRSTPISAGADGSSLTADDLEPQKIAVPLLRVHRMIQRKFIQAHADEMANNWNGAAAGILSVLISADGKFDVFDGQHRLSAMRVRKTERAWCFLFHIPPGMDEIAVAAHIQRLLGNAKAWQPLEKFKLRIKEGDPVAVAIQGIINRHGSKISPVNEFGYACVHELEEIFKYDKAGEILDRVVATTEAAWPAYPHYQRSAIVIRALGYFWSSYRGASLDKVVKSLSRMMLDVQLKKAKTMAEDDKTSKSSQLAVLLRQRCQMSTKLKFPKGVRVPWSER